MDQVKDSFEVFLQKSQQIGDVVQEMAVLVKDAVQSHWQIVDLASKVKKPSQEDLNNILKSTGVLIQKVEEFKQKNRAHNLFNHLASISESIPALGWINVAPTPGPYVKEMTDAAQFYANKVLVAYKDKDKLHVEWAQSWLEFLKNLQTYIRQVHTTGLVWNARGVEFKQNQTAPTSAPPPPPPMGGMPLPPPPPPAGGATGMQVDGDANARAALLRELNQGTDITKNLKKVNKDDRPNLLTPMSERSSRSKSPDPRATPASNRVPKFELEGRKWALEYHNGQATQDQFTIQATEMSQSVNIYRCERIMVIVQGKVNSITVDSCKKVSLVFDDIVAMVEFINCQGIQAQPMSRVPTITIDKTDGFQLFLRKESLDVELISAKSAEVNICVIDEKTGDYKEHAIPEQLKTKWGGSGFKTEAMEKA